ncbi:PHD-like zinc-binding domain-containing protein [Schizophyllum fasciatum]
MEPITNLERVNKQRFKLKCVICENRTGACIQCNKPSCFTAFHPTCARKEKLMMPMKGPQGTPAPPLIAYCERHLPPDQAAAREASLEAENEEEDEDEDGDARTKSKSARAYAKTYKPPIPLVPAIVVDRVLAYTGKIQIRKKPEFVSLICRYWSLKREARRGAPLLKRLHLEPWTASNAGQAQTEEERVAKLQQLLAVKADLEKVREMAALTCKRESRKLHQANSLRELLTAALFYNETALRAAFEKVTRYVGVQRGSSI